METSLFHYLAEAHDSIKAEPDSDFSLLSPLTSPFLLPTIPSRSPRPRRRRPHSTAARVHPYPQHLRTPDMATAPAYDNWQRPMSSKSGNERRSSDGEQPGMYMLSAPYENGFDQRPTSSGSSMGSAWGGLSSSPQMHRSPQPKEFNINMGWADPNTMNLANQDPSMYSPYIYDASSTYPRSSTDSPPTSMSQSGSSSFPASELNSPYYPASPTSASPLTTQDEVSQLRLKVRQLEKARRHDQDRIRSLENQLRAPSNTLPASPAFNTSWKARTDARIKIHCSLNRAGNALCSWHDFRREKRAYPPRTAPPGVLNCGCTYEQCLFEETLARHGVGSYLPGEAVRMDPALRNPLLKLLQDRYGYRDGDFERDVRTGSWVPGEGSSPWEAQLQSGNLNPRSRPRSDNDRH